jgi:hypothetical protein
MMEAVSISEMSGNFHETSAIFQMNWTFISHLLKCVHYGDKLLSKVGEKLSDILSVCSLLVALCTIYFNVHIST